MKHEILLTRVAAGVSTFALAIGLVTLLSNLEPTFDGPFVQKLILTLIFCGAILSLFYGNIVYQITRLGHIRRHFAHRGNGSDCDALYKAEHPRISIIIPSYKQQIPVIMQTVLSAALSEHPNRRITLLLDDPPTGKAADLIGLDAARALISELNDLFRRAAQQFRVAAGGLNLQFHPCARRRKSPAVVILPLESARSPSGPSRHCAALRNFGHQRGIADFGKLSAREIYGFTA